MADSTLDPDNMPVPDRQLGKGHGTGALGTSDTSDTGSDIVGGIGLSPFDGDADDVNSGMVGSSDDPHGGAGSDFGDPNLESDSDSSGTGERAAAGRDSTAVDDPEVGVDQIILAGEGGTADGLDEAELADIDPVHDKPGRAKQDR